MDTIEQMNVTVRLVLSSSVAEAVSVSMKAIVHRRYGTPDVLEFGEIERPVPGDDDVLVRVHAAAASIGDHHVVTGKPYVIRLSPHGGVLRPRSQVPGMALSGNTRSFLPSCLRPSPPTCRSKRQPRPPGRSHRSRHCAMWEVSRPARRY